MNGRTYIVMAAAAVVTALGLGIYAADFNGNSSEGPWPMAGHDLANSRSQPDENRISKSNVSSLTVKWTFRTGGDVSATPTVGNDAVFFPDWAGNLYAVRKDNGQQIWSARIA